MKKRIIYISLACITLTLAYLAYLYAYKYHYRIIWDHEKKRIEMFSQVEASFHKNPNASDAFDLLDYNYGLGEFRRAIFYGKKCLELGAKDESLNGKIHFFIARSHFELNQKDQAKEYLLKAIDLSHPKFDEFREVITQYKMDALLSEAEWQGIISKLKAQDL